MFINGLRAELNEMPGVDTDVMIKSVRDGAASLVEANRALVKDAPSHGHLELCSAVLSAYKNLSSMSGDDVGAVDTINRAMMRGINTWSMRASLSLMLYTCRYDPDRLRDIFSWLMKQYGATFRWTAPHAEDESSESFSIEIQRCFYYEFFKSHDATYLTPVLCRLDSLWFDMVDPKKHGFYFDKSRYQTQGYGAPVCVFPIVMNKK